MWNNPADHRLVGEILEAARKKAGLTQQEVAKVLRKPQSFVSSYESGQRRVDLLELSAIAAAVQASPYKLAKAVFDKL